MFGVDLATPIDKAHATELAKAKVEFVCRYLSTSGNPKNITANEVKILHAAGLGIVLVFETEANRALSGASGGKADGESAQLQANTLEVPRSVPIFFAVDFDATPQQQVVINEYLHAANLGLGNNRAGIYGGYWPVSRALTAKVVSWGWQSYAWSGGQWDTRAHIQQYLNNQTLAGLNVDYDRALQPNYGQWTNKLVPPPPPHKTERTGTLVHFTRVDGTAGEQWTKHWIVWAVRNPRSVLRGSVHFDRYTK